jgi:hypothetical protein
VALNVSVFFLYCTHHLILSPDFHFYCSKSLAFERCHKLPPHDLPFASNDMQARVRNAICSTAFFGVDH